jgi:hypothetical protein
LLLLSFADETLRSEFHLGADAGDLLFELQSSCSELYLHVLDFGLLLGDLNLKVLSQLVVVLQKGIQFFPVSSLGFPQSVYF